MTGRLSQFVQAHARAMVIIVLSFALAGVVFTTKLPIAIFPQTDFPRIVILVDNGITPVDIQMLRVTRPIEETIRIVPGITNLRSVTARGSTEISVFFRWDVDILNALHLVQGRISQITPSLPPECRFYINRLTFSVFPMIGFSITSPTRSQSELWELAYYDLAPRLYRLPGVAETRIVGGRRPEYHVLVDPQKLNSYGMPLTKVTEALRNSNLIQASGMVQENYHLYLTTVTGLMLTALVASSAALTARCVSRTRVGSHQDCPVRMSNSQPCQGQRMISPSFVYTISPGLLDCASPINGPSHSEAP